MSRPLLYAYSLSSCSWRVRIALAHKGIEHDIKAVPTSETRNAEHLAVNPSGQIPVLEVDGIRISESVAIMEYLEEAYPDTKPLLPTEPIKRAKVREICELIATGIQPLQNPKVASKYSDDAEKQAEWIGFYIHRGFAALEKVLSTTSTSGQYCFENNLSTADCCLVPQVYNAVERFKLDISAYPKIQSIYEALMQLESVKIAHPNNKL